jgi:4-hydroxy-3-methylbut-2-enyl diphosphate reductase
MVQSDGQIVIYGQTGHAEVEGLKGQTQGNAIVITGPNDLDLLDFSRPIELFSQTTKSTEGFYKIKQLIEERVEAYATSATTSANNCSFEANDSICRQVSNREPQLRTFAATQEVIIFVSGKKSSNGKALFAVCQGVNPKSYFVENETELDPDWFINVNSVGICGATSTPLWLMQQVQDHIYKLSALETSNQV